MSAGGSILAHSAKVLTRLYRNVPEDSVSAYLPYVPWNQNMYAAMGTMPATSNGDQAPPAHPPDQHGHQDHDEQRLADGPHQGGVADEQPGDGHDRDRGAVTPAEDHDGDGHRGR